MYEVFTSMYVSHFTQYINVLKLVDFPEFSSYSFFIKIDDLYFKIVDDISAIN